MPRDTMASFLPAQSGVEKALFSGRGDGGDLYRSLQ